MNDGSPPAHSGRVLKGCAALLALAIVAVGCGGSGDTPAGGVTGSVAATDPDEPGGELPEVADVARSLEFLGGLALVKSSPVTTTVDGSAASVSLGDGASIDIPAGSFDAPTELTTVVVDLAFDRYADSAPEGRAYVVSTTNDVVLASPVILDVPVRAGDARVMQLVDGEWQLIEVADGPTTRVPIAHFSEVPTLVVEPAEAPPEFTSAEPTGDSPADFLRACVFGLTWVFAIEAGERDDDFAASLAWSFCTRSLVDRFSPLGVRVEIECVGGKIGGDVDLISAIDACVAEAESADPPEQTDGPAENGDPSEPADPPPIASEPSTPAGPVVVSYSGPVDSAAVYETAIPETAGHVNSSGNEISAVIEDGRVVSIAMSTLVAHPQVGTVCAAEVRWALELNGPVEVIDGAFIGAGTWTVAGASTCDGTRTHPIDGVSPVTLFGELSDDGSQILLHFQPDGSRFSFVATLTSFSP